MTLPRRRSRLCSSSSPSSSFSCSSIPLLPRLPLLCSVPPSPPSPSGVEMGGLGVPQALGPPGWWPGELAPSWGYPWLFLHMWERDRRGRVSWGCPPWLRPTGKGGPEGPWGSAPMAGLPGGPQDSALCSFRSCPTVWSLPVGEEPGQCIPEPLQSQTSSSHSFSLSSTFCGWPFSPVVPFPKGLRCRGISPVAVASLQAREPLGAVSELQNEVAPCFSVSERKRRCGKL